MIGFVKRFEPFRSLGQKVHRRLILIIFQHGPDKLRAISIRGTDKPGHFRITGCDCKDTSAKKIQTTACIFHKVCFKFRFNVFVLRESFSKTAVIKQKSVFLQQLPVKSCQHAVNCRLPGLLCIQLQTG